MHIPLGRREILVPSQLLNCPCRCSTHSQVRTEGVPEDVDTLMFQVSFPSSPSHTGLHPFLC